MRSQLIFLGLWFSLALAGCLRRSALADRAPAPPSETTAPGAPSSGASSSGAPTSGADPAGVPPSDAAAGEGAADESCSAQPVSPGASKEARNLLCYLYAEYGRHILSGQEESTWVAGPEHEMDYILRHTGKLPAIRGMDFGQEGVADRAIAWWEAGGITQIGYHMGAPTHPDTYEATKLSCSIDATLTPGTPEYKSFLKKLDAAAAELQRLEDARVPVIWRPFHEAGGTWFWWSKGGAAQYIRLWTFVFEHYTKTRGLTNLIWLFPYNGEPDPAFYPGKAYVDIAGADTYAKHRGPLTPMYEVTRNIVGPTIPIALHENGPIPDPDQLKASRTPWVLFNTWHTSHIMDTSQNSVDWLRKVYNHDYVITRDELPSLR